MKGTVRPITQETADTEKRNYYGSQGEAGHDTPGRASQEGSGGELWARAFTVASVGRSRVGRLRMG